MERIFDYGGEQMQFFLGKELGDLLIITLNKYVESRDWRKTKTSNQFTVQWRQSWLSSF